MVVVVRKKVGGRDGCGGRLYTEDEGCRPSTPAISAGGPCHVRGMSRNRSSVP